ncbi:MAG: TPR end-of-group domain-containing protein, partial [Flavobacteriales bacterium]
PIDYIPIASIKKAYEANGINGVYTNSIESCLRKFGQLSNFGDFELYGDAQIYGHIGNHEKALEYLNLAVERRCSYLYLNKYNPFFKDLRSNPQFLAILDKMNLGNYNK